MEGCPDRSFEMARPIVLGYSRARCRAGERNTAFHTCGKIGTRSRGNIDNVVVDIAGHDVEVAVEFEGVSVSIGASWGRL